VLLGVVAFAGQFPAFVLGPVAGAFVDRWNRHRLIVATQAISMVQSFALAALTLTGHINVNVIIVLSLLQGAVNAFDMPGRQSFLIEMIEDKQDLGNAIAINSSMVNAARLVGPSIAGVVIAMAGEGWCFLIDGVSYVAVIVALLRMHIVAAPARATHRHPLHNLAEGLRYTFGFTPIRAIITLLAVVSLVGVPYSVLLPVFAATVFHGGAHTLGYLMTATGCGALASALWLAARPSVRGLSRLIPIAASLFGVGLIGFALAPTMWVAIPCLLLAGFGFMAQMASSNTVVQTIVDDEKRGRVMSFYMMAFLGTAPMGSLLAGWLSARIGAPKTLIAGGVCCIVGAAVFARALPAIRQSIRPIYQRLGILPQVANAIAESAELTVPPERR
jgi:MFS family permease